MLPPNALPNVTTILIRAAILLQHFDEKRKEAARREIARYKRHFASYPDSEMTIDAMMIRFGIASKQLLRSVDQYTGKDVFSWVAVKVKGFNLDLTPTQIKTISDTVVAVSDCNKNRSDIEHLHERMGEEE